MIAFHTPVHVFASTTALRDAVRTKLWHAGISPPVVAVPDAGAVVLVAGASVDEALNAWPVPAASVAEVRLMVAADTLTPAGVLRAVRAGVRTMVTTDATPEQFRAAAQSAVSGESRLPYGVLVRLLSGGAELSMPPGPAIPSPGVVLPLTDRQLAVLSLVADGHGNTEIAKTLSCSEHTVKNVLYELMARLQVRNRAHAVAHAVRAGLI